ncbi:hypothetical protein PBAL39_18749 [Pedobacter sp. BAL39]|uniref:hypothetical protein n=1 Tax=Pedobacter sp. BAL39 TaxID=391596 RepID=UPI0001559812|nr:hypothetical protein [Pedobacter sp. BAL39]EDM36942.1 hypothetical protein PBAL39_18749 [Pedobacter sp. BAL39]
MRTFTSLLAALLALTGTLQGQTKNKAPKIEYLMIDGKKEPSKAYLNPGEMYLIKVAVADPENDPLTAKWELFAEAELRDAATQKRPPVAIPDVVVGSLKNAMLKVPITAGPYKLLLHVMDNHKNMTTAGITLVVLK